MTSKFFPPPARALPSLATLRHVHLNRNAPFLRTSTLQSKLATDLLQSKSFLALPSRSPRPLAAQQPFPPPTILTMEFESVYTLGRRDRKTLPAAERLRLLNTGAKVYETLRGGRSTFHGPGQMTAYIVTDLIQHKLTPRSYVSLLEDALIDTCAEFSVRAIKTANTGVWVNEDVKIGAVGVHMRRNVTSFGVALNVHTNLGWYENIVACGLEGKGTTSLMAEKKGRVGMGLGVERVAEVFAEVIRRRLGCGKVDRWEESRLVKWIEERTVQTLKKRDITDFVRITA